MSNPIKIAGGGISLPTDFHIEEVRPAVATAVTPAPSLGPLAAFVGTFSGTGFNTIFRPDSPKTPTPLPIPVNGSDNILELNLTSETLSFSASLGSIPNRGMVQADAFLNAVPYTQAINDVTTPGQSSGIHFEPGLWVIVPTTTQPGEGTTLVRMASIPHGTTILAQGTSVTFAGPPQIEPVGITPFVTVPPGAPPAPPLPAFPSQTATAEGTPRIPQNLTSLIANGHLTQAMLTDPNMLLRNHNAGLTIKETTAIIISTKPTAPLFGDDGKLNDFGTANIAFLLGDAAAAKPNAQTLQMSAIFWISTVEHTIVVPIFKPGQAPLKIKPQMELAGRPAPTFLVTPPIEITEPRTITVLSTQIQYTQTVLLNFNGLTWPHVSVATLVPSDPVPAPPVGGW